MGLTSQHERRAAELVLEHAQKRWPHANRVTHPLLVDALEELKAKALAAAKEEQRNG